MTTCNYYKPCVVRANWETIQNAYGCDIGQVSLNEEASVERKLT